MPAAPPDPPRSGFAIDVPASVLARARAGDRAAFEQIYRWFERPIFTLALRMLGGRHGNGRDEAHEVLQDTMLKVIDRIGDFRGRSARGHNARSPSGLGEDGSASPFWGWLRQIAINEALMRLRRGRRLEREICVEDEAGFADDRVLDGGFADHDPLPPAAADAAVLQRALATLPATTRSVLWLYHAEGHTHEEIAALMGKTASFSKSQLARGTRRLRGLLVAPDQPQAAAARPEVSHV
ncbi:MAG TPA: sigma-70 family RNA polymerase sigma factor [Xanthomonadaceae bacterium]|nr:sigma-70 family RNA polymerase sigma factor [Xanthomonadaceae bacterium]